MNLCETVLSIGGGIIMWWLGQVQRHETQPQITGFMTILGIAVSTIQSVKLGPVSGLIIFILGMIFPLSCRIC